ncbi:hypothetical protein EVAR_46173_1 [Eumeta japonica]|uniref:Neurotransmitter-gated ion-channel ligand-binding domain-containing protein n=1 Tax=Eumeta variegata TaxID=151549 RepID=A0A4C1XZ03_EUMVA|nr:hypothetical protein EVAR_46173_1 [Eumeta japonica]
MIEEQMSKGTFPDFVFVHLLDSKPGLTLNFDTGSVLNFGSSNPIFDSDLAFNFDIPLVTVRFGRSRGALGCDEEYRLVRHLMQKYDASVRPVENSSHPLLVTFGVSLHHIIDVIERLVTKIRAGPWSGLIGSLQRGMNQRDNMCFVL